MIWWWSLTILLAALGVAILAAAYDASTGKLDGPTLFVGAVLILSAVATYRAKLR
jgi:hypothetical protein